MRKGDTFADQLDLVAEKITKSVQNTIVMLYLHENTDLDSRNRVIKELYEKLRILFGQKNTIELYIEQRKALIKSQIDKNLES